jgi:putative hydrolase
MIRPQLRGDFHVHSTFSDDAVSTLAQNIAAASAIGLTELRLIDHVRVSTTWVPEFVAAVTAEPVPEGLTVLTGVEAKIMNAAGEVDVPAGLAGVDAIVIADHQFPGTDGPWTPDATRRRIEGGLDPLDALDLLIGALVGAMERTARDRVAGAQLAHCFSILPKIGLSEADLTDEHLRVWAATAARTATLIEVNEKWACPGPRSVRAAFDAGARIVASTDAHVASDVGRYDRVPAILDEALGVYA